VRRNAREDDEQAAIGERPDAEPGVAMLDVDAASGGPEWLGTSPSASSSVG
jgi:hypothetical protein